LDAVPGFSSCCTGEMTATAAETLPEAAGHSSWAERLDRYSGSIMVLPAVVVLLCFAIFPLIISAYLALSRFALAPGGFTLKFIGLTNFRKLLTGSQQYHLLGTFGWPGSLQWAILALIATGLLFLLARYLLSGRITITGLAGRLLAAAVAFGLALVAVITFATGGVPGTVVNTLLYVVVGATVQFALGLGLALLCSQPIRGRNFYRVLFFVPLMVTPVGIAYTFRMLADMQKGPFAPLLRAFGVSEWSWATEAWSARLMVLIGDTWQWTPFMFIVLLAAIENQPRDQVEAARLDGAGNWQVFRDITWPAIAPVAATVVLIRLIEAFKIIDLPNVLTGGGPGLATESMTLHSFIAWRTQDLGGSAAVGYMLLFISTVACVSFFNFVVRPARRFEA
jgi:multiple sugar transport system permease protein